MEILNSENFQEQMDWEPQVPILSKKKETNNLINNEK